MCSLNIAQLDVLIKQRKLQDGFCFSSCLPNNLATEIIFNSCYCLIKAECVIKKFILPDFESVYIYI